jgi:replication fork protection complex subunit Csm3/Swi3
MMRMDWINEGKPKYSVHEDSIFDEPVLPLRETSNNTTAAPKIAPIFERNQNERQTTPGLFVDADEDIYNATPRVERAQATAPPGSSEVRTSLFGHKKTTVSDEQEDDLDDLDALLAEQEMEAANNAKGSATKSQDHDMIAPEQNYDDDMEAMAEIGVDW